MGAPVHENGRTVGSLIVISAPGGHDFGEAQEQVGFADKILMSKTDLVGKDEVDKLSQRIRKMNPRAPIKPVHFGEAPIQEVLDLRGFNLNAILELDPTFLTDASHEHHDEVESFVFRSDKPFNGDKLEQIVFEVMETLRQKGML